MNHNTMTESELLMFYRKLLRKRTQMGKKCIGIRKRLEQLTRNIWSFE